jgi:2-keto-4-pentenoate hydratase/2-oxohepta-3-ene-1,7-dioic acid hydratase in catechol pathway
MKIASVRTPRGARSALLVGDLAYDIGELLGVPQRLPDAMALLTGDDPLLDSLHAQREQLLAAVENGGRRDALLGRIDALDLGPPITSPSKILCAGLNYADHVAEIGAPMPHHPLVFAKLPSAIIGPADPIVVPEGLSSQVDYEVELAVVVGRGGRDFSPEEAPSRIAGYLVCNDVSARDWQFDEDGQLTLGKGLDTFFPIGPWLTTADEIVDPGNLRVSTTINDVTVQDSSTAELIRGVAWLVSWLSTVCTLMPGDIIATGTPPGVGVSRKPQVFLSTGDLVVCEIEHLGRIENRFVIAPRPHTANQGSENHHD